MAAITLEFKSITYTFARLRLITTILTVDDIADITLELSEREIYNDIRASTNQTTAFETAYATKEVKQDICAYPPEIDPNSIQYVTFNVESGDTEITWIGFELKGAGGVTVTIFQGHPITEAECDSIEGSYRVSATGTHLCMFGSMVEYIIVEPYSQTGNTYTLKITNTHTTRKIRYSVTVTYRYLAERTIELRETDDTSIAKYGRRTMNLVWDLGMSIDTVQQMIESYLERYSEPVSLLYITVQGKTDRLASFVFSTKINDRVRIIHTPLGLNHDFWVNQLIPEHRTDGMLECAYVLEEVRALENFALFELDTSILDGEEVLAP